MTFHKPLPGYEESNENAGQQTSIQTYSGKENGGETEIFNYTGLCLTVTGVIKTVARTHWMGLCFYK